MSALGTTQHRVSLSLFFTTAIRSAIEGLINSQFQTDVSYSSLFFILIIFVISRDGSFDIPLSKLRSQGILFEGPAAVTQGMITTTYRKFQIFLSKCLPYGKYLYDERDFVSYGELLRYIAVKDQTLFVYTEESAANPIYTIPIESLHPVKENSNKPHPRSLTISPMTNSNMQAQDLQTVLLLDARDRLVLQCTFHCKNNPHTADDFIHSTQKNVNKSVYFKKA